MRLAIVFLIYLVIFRINGFPIVEYLSVQGGDSKASEVL